jgi:hypothetical protein
MLPSVGREHYRLSVTDGCRGRGDDGTSIRFRVPESVINIAHIPKELRDIPRLTSLPVNARERSWPSLWVNWGVAFRAEKVADILEPDNLKALGNAIRMRAPSVRLRKPGGAGLSTIRTPKVFNPMVEDDHSANMRLWMSGSSLIRLKRRGTRCARADWSGSRRS